MYPVLIFSHSIVRWFVVVTLLFAIYRGIRGWSGRKPFTKFDDSVRHTAATFSHIQLMIGYVLYFNSPFITYFRTHYKEAVSQFEFVFFGMIHITLMTIAIFVLSAGSSIAKRNEDDLAKFKTMTIYYIIAAVIILIAIPWPFSPLSARPYLRDF
ncbi:hypothetical protein [Dyadobacter luticola]|uniref:Cytochrome B n=1 Tax=Dyadobacter luticola TaxID=1979387 RepID=A0A5R9L2F2_9BACT|nr:hypothetical protein [Dyadobacter luticola]TLV02567.1 hypothetical protein FEN17_02805 [Dyadobacter luticola]